MVQIQPGLIVKKQKTYKLLTKKLLQGDFLSAEAKSSKKLKLLERSRGTLLTKKYDRRRKGLQNLVKCINFKGLNVSVKGRLKGVRRARKVEVHFRGTRPNSFAQPQHFYQSPIKTK